MSQQKFKVVISNSTEDFIKVPEEKVAAFNQRLHERMKEVDRNFQRKQRRSTEKAAKIVLNA